MGLEEVAALAWIQVVHYLPHDPHTVAFWPRQVEPLEEGVILVVPT